MVNANVALGFTLISLNLSGVKGNMEEIFEFFLKSWEHHRISGSKPGMAGDENLHGMD